MDLVPTLGSDRCTQNVNRMFIAVLFAVATGEKYHLIIKREFNYSK